MMRSASENPVSRSPWPKSMYDTILGGDPSGTVWSCAPFLMTGASGLIASSTSVTWGRISYSTSISFIASLAASADVAATAATACPSYRALSPAIVFYCR